jgi:AraC-like DNA-binding protein
MEILYATVCDTVIWVNGEPHPFKSGDLAVINPNEPHAFTFNGTSNYICVKFAPEILATDNGSIFQFQYVFPMFSKDLKKRVFHAEELGDADVKGLTEEIMSEWDSGSTAKELIIRANIMKIFTLILRLWEKDSLFSFDSKPSDTMQKALVYISEKRACVTEEEVASICSLSPNYFSRTFKKFHDISPASWRREKGEKPNDNT